MYKRVKLMLLGIFLAVASVWCLIAGSGNVVFSVIGFYLLPLAAILCFAMGFGDNRQKEDEADTAVPPDEEDKE